MSAAGGIFAVPKYAAALNKVVANYGIETHYGHDLVEIRADKKKRILSNWLPGKK